MARSFTQISANLFVYHIDVLYCTLSPKSYSPFIYRPVEYIQYTYVPLYRVVLLPDGNARKETLRKKNYIATVRSLNTRPVLRIAQNREIY